VINPAQFCALLLHLQEVTQVNHVGRKQLADHIKPAAAAAKIPGKVGWHSLRHTYSSLLRDLATDVKVQQELSRHADTSTTSNICTQAVSTKKRKAARKAVKALLKPQHK
jgi:site-specific recombinase XerD